MRQLDLSGLSILTQRPEHLPRKMWVSLLKKKLEWTVRQRKTSFDKQVFQFRPSERAFLLSQINRLRKKLGIGALESTFASTFQGDLISFFRRDSIRFAQALARCLSPSERKKVFVRLLKDDEYRELSCYSPSVDECLDRIIGLNESRIKSKLIGRKMAYATEEIYIESPPEELFTPYRVMVSLLKKLQVCGSKFVDLGCGLGRMGIVCGTLFPEIEYVGYEIVKERFLQAKRTQKALKLKSVRFLNVDLGKTGFKMPEASYYYLFNPFTARVLRKVFLNLKQVSEKKELCVIIARIGRPPKMILHENWLIKEEDFLNDPYWEARGLSFFRSVPR